MKAKTAASLLTGALFLSATGSALADPVSYSAILNPENNSGVSGTVSLMLNGNQLTTTIAASGLVPDQPHMAHIHGLLGAAAPGTRPAPPSADANHDGFVESTEGAVYSGPPLFATPQTVSPLAYPTASANGTISYTQTYAITDTALYDPMHMGLSLTPADILGTTGGNMTPLVDRLIELHGMDVPAGIDGTTGAPGTLVYDPDMPVAGGMITRAGSATSVSEPSSLALLGSAVIGMIALTRRRRRAA